MEIMETKTMLAITSLPAETIRRAEEEQRAYCGGKTIGEVMADVYAETLGKKK